MAIRELEIFPQVTYSAGQGMIGIRKWVLDHDDDLEQFLGYVCTSHWPELLDCLPIQVQTGAFWDEAIPVGYARTQESFGPPPTFNKVQVVAQYALHRATNCWPQAIPKPRHLPGTTLSLKIRGSGQALVVSPAGFKLTPQLLGECNADLGAFAVEALDLSTAARIIVPVAEYQVSCDRLTLAQLDSIGGPGGVAVGGVGGFDVFDGCTNSTKFLGADPGTLLMDGYEVTETFVCDNVEPLRYCVTICFKHRIITGANGLPLQTKAGDNGEGYDVPLTGGEQLPDQGALGGIAGVQTVGWNHDFLTTGGKTGWGWHLLTMKDGENNCNFRYPIIEMGGIFMNDNNPQGNGQPCGEAAVGDADTESPMSDTFFCQD